MLTVHVLHGKGYQYYVADLESIDPTAGRAAGESPGEWLGAGASQAGLLGAIDAQPFGEVMEGRHPQSGQTLRRQVPRAVSGYDLTFAAPKSVSVLHLLAPGEISAEVGSGHHAAVAEAAGYLERSGLGVCRKTSGGRVRLASTGAVAGAFVHRTSRALDPHLHSHVVVANVAQGVDGIWSAVDSRRLFAHCSAARGVYHARLRMELGGRLGVAWEVRPSGFGDVAGVPPALRHLFSQRSAAMREFDHLQGNDRAAAGERRGPSHWRRAFHATRDDKDRTRDVASLTVEWQERALAFGFDLGDLTKVVGLGRASRPGAEIDAARVRDGLARTADRHPRLAHRDLVAVVAAASLSGAQSSAIEAAASRMVCAAGGPAGSQSGDAGQGHEPRSGPEPRWAAEDVIRAVERSGAVVLEPGPEEQEPAEARRRQTRSLQLGVDREGSSPLGRRRSELELGRSLSPGLGR